VGDCPPVAGPSEASFRSGTSRSCAARNSYQADAASSRVARFHAFEQANVLDAKWLPAVGKGRNNLDLLSSREWPRFRGALSHDADWCARAASERREACDNSPSLSASLK